VYVYSFIYKYIQCLYRYVYIHTYIYIYLYRSRLRQTPLLASTIDQTRISGLRVTEQTRIPGQVTDKQYTVSISKEDIQESCIQSFQALSTLSSLVKEGTMAGIHVFMYMNVCIHVYLNRCLRM
jgi:hypothetical protein